MVTMATPTLFQHVMGGSNPNAGGTSLPGNNYKFTLPNAVGVGNCLILGLSYPSGATLSSITDTQTNSWSTTPAVSADAGAGNMKSGLWVLKSSAAGVTTITVSFSANVNEFRYKISEFYNVDTVAPVDGSHGTGATPISG